MNHRKCVKQRQTIIQRLGLVLMMNVNRLFKKRWSSTKYEIQCSPFSCEDYDNNLSEILKEFIQFITTVDNFLFINS